MPYQAGNNQIDTNSSPDFDKDINSEEAIKNTKIRKRIDELLEKKKLKEMLDDSDDWDV